VGNGAAGPGRSGFLLGYPVAWVGIDVDRKPSNLKLYLGDTIIGSATIVIDVLLIIVIGVWYLSIRRGYIPLSLRVLASSMICFVLLDLVYYYLYAQGLYHPFVDRRAVYADAVWHRGFHQAVLCPVSDRFDNR
jgi:hypothetical protein